MSTWDNIIKINDNSHIFVAKALDSNLGQRFDPLFIEFYSLNIVRRLVFIQKGISPHLKGVETKPQLELPIGILLRTACLDILQYGFIIKCLDEVKIENPPRPNVIPDYSDFKNTLRKVFSGNIKNQIEDDKCLRDVGVLREDEFLRRKKILENKYYWLLSENKEFLDSLPARKIFKSLRSSRKYDNFSCTFEDYSFYSKLEHFGIFSWIYTIPDKDTLPIILHRIKRNLMSILHVYKISFVYLQKDEKDIGVIDEWLSQLYNINVLN